MGLIGHQLWFHRCSLPVKWLCYPHEEEDAFCLAVGMTYKWELIYGSPQFPESSRQQYGPEPCGSGFGCTITG
jgi:hypothetical protein